MTTRKVFSATVRVYATMYAIADSAEEAQAMFAERVGDGLQVGESEDVSGLSYNSPDLPELSFSPMMTIDADQQVLVEDVELVDECELEDEETP